MQDYYPDLAILAAFVALCAVDIGIGHSPIAGLVVVAVGLVVIAAFVLVIRFGFRAGDSNHVAGQP